MTRCEVNDEEVCNVYCNYHYLFHRVVAAKTQQYMEEKADLSVVFNILIHSVKFLKCCMGKYLLHILDRATNFVHGIKLTDDKHHLQIVQLQIDILELTYCKTPERCMKIGNESIYKSYISLLSSILKSLFDAKLLIKAKDVVNKTVECIVTWTRNDEVSNNCSTFLQDVLHLLFERPLNFANKLEACTIVFESLVLKYRNSKILSWTCVTIAHVLHSVSLYWTSQCAEEWNQYMSLNVQKAFIHFISSLSELLLTSQCVKCTLPSGEDCPVNNDTVSSVNLLTIVISCVMSSVVNKSEGFAKLLFDAKTALNEAIARIKVLKQADCPMWKYVWKRLGIKMYNLGVHCNSAELIYEAKEVFSKFCWTCIQLGEQPASPEVENGILDRVMTYLMQIYRDLKKYRGALRIAAIGMVILPDFKEKFVQQWAKIKNYALTENCKDVQILTIYDILKEDGKIGILCPDISLEAVNFQQLLILELEAYSLSSFSSWQCVQAAYDKFCELSPSSSIHIKGLLAYLPSLWISGSTDECTQTIRSAKNILQTMQIESQNIKWEKEHLCLLGNLYYWLFLCQLKVTRSKQEEEILSSNIIPTKMQSQQQDNHDPLETCDVTPAYRNLSLENESKTLETLNKAVTCWTNALQNGFSTVTERVDPLPNIEVAASLYQLYGYVTQKMRTWCLYIKYAEILNNKEAMLLGLCHLLEWCTCGMAECKLLMAAENITVLLKLESNEEFPSRLLFHKYCLARGRHCLRNEKFMEIGDYMEKLVVFTKQENIEHFAQSILHVQTVFLISQCKCLPRPHIVTWPSKSEMDIFSEATSTYRKAMSLLKQVRMTPAENAQVLSLMLEISLWLGQLTLELFWPREARCFMKGDLILSQKLGLATRTAQFLNVLAQVDAMCCNANDCQVKLQGMEGLLQLESRFQPYDIASKNRKIDADSERCHELEQMTLERSARIAEFRDIPKVPWRNRSPCGSPNLRKLVFVLPSFVKHPTDCQCHMCNTLALQTLALNAVCIQAQVYNIQSELKEALEFFEGGLQLCQQLIYKQLELIRKLSSEVHQLVLGQGDCSDCFLLLLHPLKLGRVQVARGYADFLAASSSYTQAWKLNAEALQEVETLKLAHPHLAVDVMDQAFCIEQAQASASEPKKYKEECDLKVQETPRQVVDATIKTPLNTSSLSQCVRLPLSVSNIKKHNHSPFKIKPRKLILPEIENGDPGKENKRTANGRSVTKTRIRAHKQKASKTVTFFEDSPAVSQREKLPASNSGVAQKSSRALRSKTSQKETHSKHGVSEHESLSSVCEVLEFRIDSPGNHFEIHQVSFNRKQENTSVRNKKTLSPNVIVDEETNFIYLGLQGLDVSINDINNEVFETTESQPVSKQAGQLNRKPNTSENSCNIHAPELKAPRSLRTYSRQNNKAQMKERSQTFKEVLNEEAVVRRPKDDDSMSEKNAKAAGKQACSSRKAVKKTSDSSQVARKTRGRGKSDCSHASESDRCKSSEKENSDEALITHMENLVLDSRKDECSNANDGEKFNTKSKTYKKTNKVSQCLFTPSRKVVRKEHDETLVPSSSPDEQLDVYGRQTNKQSKKEWKEKVIPSSASEDETPNLKSDISNEEEATLLRIKPKKGVSSSKKRRLPVRHRFILN
ncbi:hypothetical protein B7P43_G05592 [Cryptotermes secundus]|nr:hypothetical protein B7P43_G05592 [Cryptotermes secundus]